MLAIFPIVVEQGRVAALNILGRDTPCGGFDAMNSLNHLGLPIIAVGQAVGEKLRVRRNDVFRKVYMQRERMAGFRLAGGTSAAGTLRSLMNRRLGVDPLKDTPLVPQFALGVISEKALAARSLV